MTVSVVQVGQRCGATPTFTCMIGEEMPQSNIGLGDLL